MFEELQGWWGGAVVWGLVCILAYLLKLSKVWVHAYRIRRGRMQMNEWLKLVGETLDLNYEEGTAYSKDAVKEFLAEMSVTYYKRVMNKKPE